MLRMADLKEQAENIKNGMMDTISEPLMFTAVGRNELHAGIAARSESKAYQLTGKYQRQCYHPFLY